MHLLGLNSVYFIFIYKIVL